MGSMAERMQLALICKLSGGPGEGENNWGDHMETCRGRAREQEAVGLQGAKRTEGGGQGWGRGDQLVRGHELGLRATLLTL